MERNSLLFAFALLVGTAVPTVAQDSAVPEVPKGAGANNLIVTDTEAGSTPWCDFCNPCASRWRVNADYLFWWMKGTLAPPLLTTTTNTSVMNFGGVNQSGTQILYGGNHIGMAMHTGGQLNVGYWLNDARTWSAELGGFGLDTGGSQYLASSDGSTVLTRPFSDPTGTTSSLVVAGIQPSTRVVDTGLIDIRYRSRMWGGEGNLRGNLFTSDVVTLDFLAGFRIVGLDERLDLDGQSSPSTASSAGTVRYIDDLFKTTNRFYGGQLGLNAEFRLGRWFIGVQGKAGLGGTQSYTIIDGSQVATIISNGVLNTSESGVTPGGLLTTSTNLGHYIHNQFSFISEAGLKLGYQVTPRIRAYAAYNFFYWNNIARPGTEIDWVIYGRTQVAPNAAPDTSRPKYAYTSDAIWAQGVNVGMEFRF